MANRSNISSFEPQRNVEKQILLSLQNIESNLDELDEIIKNLKNFKQVFQKPNSGDNFISKLEKPKKALLKFSKKIQYLKPTLSILKQDSINDKNFEEVVSKYKQILDILPENVNDKKVLDVIHKIKKIIKYLIVISPDSHIKFHYNIETCRGKKINKYDLFIGSFNSLGIDIADLPTDIFGIKSCNDYFQKYIQILIGISEKVNDNKQKLFYRTLARLSITLYSSRRDNKLYTNRYATLNMLFKDISEYNSSVEKDPLKRKRNEVDSPNADINDKKGRDDNDQIETAKNETTSLNLYSSGINNIEDLYYDLISTNTQKINPSIETLKIYMEILYSCNTKSQTNRFSILKNSSISKIQEKIKDIISSIEIFNVPLPQKSLNSLSNSPMRITPMEVSKLLSEKTKKADK